MRATAEPTPDACLDRRPEARVLSIEQLVQWVQEGHIRFPPFQRALRWRAKHVLALFDSVYRGFPIGGLLLSRQPASTSDAELYVVDGQQRVTSLAGALLHPDPSSGGDIHAIWFDLEQRTFARLTSSTAPLTWIPLCTVLDSFRLLNWLSDWALRAERPDLVHAAIALGKAIREYQVPTYIVEGASESTLRLIFKRTNTSGVQMTEEEVFAALYGRREGDPLKNVCIRLGNRGAGRIKERWFLRCLKAVKGLHPRMKFDDDEILIDDADIRATEGALGHVLGFLARDAGIPHLALLPYRTPLLCLARFFHLHPQPSTRSRALLSRWLWRSALSRIHAIYNPMPVADLLNATGEVLNEIVNDEGRAVQALLHALPALHERDLYPDPSHPFNQRSPLTRVIALGMLHLSPRDLITSTVLDPEEMLALPSPIQAFRELSGGALVGTGAMAERIIFLSARPDLQRLLQASAEVLESHAISPEAADALRRGDLAAFGIERAGSLTCRLYSFFRERTGMGEPDRPAISEIARWAREMAAAS